MNCQRCQKPLSGRSRKWCSDNCRKRAADDAHRAICVDCGEPLGTRSGWAQGGRPTLRCVDCERDHRREQHAARVRLVADLYNEGKTIREIGEHLGYAVTARASEVCEARRLGLIGYRNRGYGQAA